MDICFNCGNQTDPDWVFCRSCGSGLDAAEAPASPPDSSPDPVGPKVELISRGWDDVVDIDTIDPLPEPLEGDVIYPPVPPGAIEVSVEDVTVVATPPQDSPHDAEADPSAVPAQAAAVSDAWDHLRPHGEIPPLRSRSTALARYSLVSLLLVALAALVATFLRFYLNTRLEGFGEGRVSAQAVADVEAVADASLLVMLGLAVVAMGFLGLWMIKSFPDMSLRPGLGGLLGILAGLAGTGLVAAFFFIEQETVADAMTANSLIVVGLGLLMMACLTAVRKVGRLDLRGSA